MTPSTLYSALTERGVAFRTEGDLLRVRGKLTDADREAIRRHKRDLLAWLRLRDQWTVEVAEASDGADWFTCWPVPCRARWAASILGVADEHGIAIDPQTRRWLEALAKHYQE